MAIASSIRDCNESLCSSPDEYEHEELDPRVKVELDRLNGATDEINKLESALEDANNSFRHDLSEASSSLQLLGRKLGSAVEKARPYFEAMQHARKLHLDCQRTAVQYQRANSVHQAARSTISLAEERFSNAHLNQRQFDPAWQEMLNHATRKVLEAEAGRSASEREHEKRAAAFTAAQQRVAVLGRQLKSSIDKARPYFEQKDNFDAQMEQMSLRVEELQRAVANAKLSYSHALRNLERISEEIHEQRRYGGMENLTREPGVGAEDKQFTESSLSVNVDNKEPTIAELKTIPEPFREADVPAGSALRAEGEKKKVNEDSYEPEMDSDASSLGVRECGSGDESPPDLRDEVFPILCGGKNDLEDTITKDCIDVPRPLDRAANTSDDHSITKITLSPPHQELDLGSEAKPDLHTNLS
ncbi:SH3 domain-binding protein 5 homolog [Hyalella azteca]|uniref:SH3 domain-binding protein 5 homolog n=1 Tax=Hyalella azteca TaxID=294128 RepID=A0A8B7NHL9_HYAAZ|nr:SH3 domain-binding protein 5 homolog [Hyalella azteca]